METLVTFLIGFGITLFFVSRYLKSLKGTHHAGPKAAVPAAPSQPCPRCGQPVELGAGFCQACGAPMALWNVHRASVQTETSQPGEKGKPRPIINATLCIGCGSCVDACPETGTLGLKGGKAILVNPTLCVGHAKCVDVCPTSAISLAFGNVLQTLRVPLVNENFETNIRDLFIVGELGGMGLIKTAINEGRLAVEHIRQRLEAAGISRKPADAHGPAPQPLDPEDGLYDLAIVGAGPAGLSASLTAQQHGMRYVTLEQGEVASTIRNYPRHKFLMAEPVQMPLYGSLYVGDGTKESLLSVWEAIIANTAVRINTNEKVESIRRNTSDGGFDVQSPKGVYRARYVVLALGKRGVPRHLDVPGEDLDKVAYRLIEAEDYEGKNILVVGGGDSAIEAALAVSKAGRNRVTLSYRGEDFRRARERNQAMLAEREKEGHLTILRQSTVAAILPHTVRLTVKGDPLEIPNDYVFILAGGVSPEDFLRKIGVEIVEKVVTV